MPEIVKAKEDGPDPEIKPVSLSVELPNGTQAMVFGLLVQDGDWRTEVYAESAHRVGNTAVMYPVDGIDADGFTVNV